MTWRIFKTNHTKHWCVVLTPLPCPLGLKDINNAQQIHHWQRPMAAVGVRNLNNTEKKEKEKPYSWRPFTPNQAPELISAPWRVMERVLSGICQLFDGLIYWEGWKRWRATIQKRTTSSCRYGGPRALRKPSQISGEAEWWCIDTHRTFIDEKLAFSCNRHTSLLSKQNFLFLTHQNPTLCGIWYPRQQTSACGSLKEGVMQRDFMSHSWKGNVFDKPWPAAVVLLLKTQKLMPVS